MGNTKKNDKGVSKGKIRIPLGMIFAEMGHWYPWATREYVLYKMSAPQVFLYHRMITLEGRLKQKTRSDGGEKPDLIALRKELRITFDASDLAGFMKQHFGEDAKFPNTQRAENGKA